MKTYIALTFGLAILLIAPTSWPEKSETPKARAWSALPSDSWKSRPTRRDTPLRFENISDREVAEVKILMNELFPGSIVYISAVITGCPCEDGPQCAEQVWSVAYFEENSNGVVLSRVEGAWQLGRLQEWWLTRDRLSQLYKQSTKDESTEPRISFQEYERRVQEHDLSYPMCSVGPVKDDA